MVLYHDMNQSHAFLKAIIHAQGSLVPFTLPLEEDGRA